MVIGIIAGGDSAIRKAVEFAEDSTTQAGKTFKNTTSILMTWWLESAPSGTAPYGYRALMACQENGVTSGRIACNVDSPMAHASDFPIEVVVGPEFVTGSTRMKSGTAQKLVLNMITTTTMVVFGRVKGNKMVDMQLSNNKLVDRGIRMIMEETGIDRELAEKLLTEHGSVRKAVDFHTGNQQCIPLNHITAGAIITLLRMICDHRFMEENTANLSLQTTFTISRYTPNGMILALLLFSSKFLC